MTTSPKGRRWLARLFRVAWFAIAAVAIGCAIGAFVVRSDWANNQVRELLLAQAAQYLDATLDIERIDGSLFGGVRFVNVRLSRDGEELVAIDSLSASYALRELFGDGVTVRRLTVTRPRVTAFREQDGRWNIAALLRQPERTESESASPRAVAIPSLRIVDGVLTLGESMAFGAARLPARFEHLNLSLGLGYRDSAWNLDFSDASWTSSQPDLRVEHLAGSLAVESGRFALRALTVETPGSEFAVNGSISRGTTPVLDLHIQAEHFAFQEWATIVPALSDIAVESSFDVSLQGSLEHLSTAFDLTSNGGDLQGDIVLDSSVPGWHGSGSVALNRFDLGPWLSRPDQASDITGRLEFDMNLQLGRGFPRTDGSYVFDGSRAAIFGYEASELLARGRTTGTAVAIHEATLTAYGSRVRLNSGSVGFEAPFVFRFVGSADMLDLRRLPSSVPVPRVQSRLGFAYDVAGQFRDPVVRGSAEFGPSTFLGSRIERGATGRIDTSLEPFTYGGDGHVREIDLGRFGVELGIGWLQDPRYAGSLEGRFHVEGSGGDVQARRLDVSGRVDRAALFDGVFSDADVTVQIDHGSLTASFDGRFEGVNAATAFIDARLDAPLTGSGVVNIAVPDLLVRPPELADYTIDTNVTLETLTIRDVHINEAALTGLLTAGMLDIRHARIVGPLVDVQGTGVVDLVGQQITHIDYDVTRGDLGLLVGVLDTELRGQIATAGRVTGSLERPRAVGRASLADVGLPGAAAHFARIDYDLVVPSAEPEQLTGQLHIAAESFELLGRVVPTMTGDFALAGRIVGLNVDAVLVDALGTAPEKTVTGTVRGTAAVHADRQGLDLTLLEMTVGDVAWRMSTSTATSVITWGAGAVTVDALEVVHGDSERIAVSGTWRPAGGSALRIAAADVFLDTFARFTGEETRYGGRMNLDATLGGSWEQPFVAGRVIVTDGRIRRLPYEQLAGRVDYTDEIFTVDLRLDQAPGIWLTASGTLPAAIFDQRRPERPMKLAIASSPIALGLLEGVTDVIREVTGDMQVEVTALGTSHDPHLSGSVAVTDAGFQVAATGARYRGGRGAVLLDRERVTVNSMTLTDADGDVLEVRGSLGTHEMTVGDIAAEVVAQGFQVLDNEFGRVDVDAQISLTGRFESPRVSGDVTLTDGVLRADTILDSLLFRPYSGADTTLAIDALAALNPWERLGLDIFLHVPGTVRLVGDNVQVTEGTPLGLGSFDLRVFGDPYLYKDPAGPMYVTGSLDQVTGTYAFQGRRFDLDPESSINFRGDLSPDVWVTVNRVISGVETRVSIIGSLREPELQLASTPPLDASDILSLIVFNTSTNQLSIAQQQELAIRAGTLAAGFLTAPLLTALERSIGIDTLEVESGTVGSDIRVTIGDEIAPGLVARFSRQFGQDQYEEATVEYNLSRILRIRATFSDAGALASRSPLQRYERAGIDLLLFFSF